MFNWINPSRCQGHLYKQTGNKKTHNYVTEQKQNK